MSDYSKKPSFKETGLKSAITEFALALTALKGEYFYPSGTAVVIASCLAMTAKHVIEDYWSNFEQENLGNNSEGSFSIMAIQVLNNGESGTLWNVTKIWLCDTTDIAFLFLTPASDNAKDIKLKYPRINLVPPGVGTRITGFGYPKSEVIIEKVKEKDVYVLWKDSPSTTIGEVIEVFDQKRDSYLLSFPCFRVNARFDHGMSGGPIFNDNGELCGIISCSSSMPEEDFHDSYVASLWPAMATQIDINRDGFEPSLSYPVIELAKNGLIHAKNWEKVKINRDEFGKVTSVSLQP